MMVGQRGGTARMPQRLRSRFIVGAAVVTVLIAGAACVPTADPTSPVIDDHGLVALDIVPGGSFAPPSYGDVGREARMYDALTPKGTAVTSADLAADFKSASLGFPAGETPIAVERPR